MANNSNKGDEGRTWAQLIEGYNAPSKPGDANQTYSNSVKESIFYCVVCKLCYYLIPNSYKKVYRSEYIDNFPSFGKPKRACTSCAEDGAYFWGCLGGNVKK